MKKLANQEHFCKNNNKPVVMLRTESLSAFTHGLMLDFLAHLHLKPPTTPSPITGFNPVIGC